MKRLKEHKLRSTLESAIIIGLSLMVVSACGTSKNESVTLEKYCAKYVEDYKVIEKKDNGIVKISVSAPDFKKIAKLLVSENDKDSWNVETIKKLAQENPDYKKKYELDVKNNDEDEVEKEFYNEVSKELMIDAIENIKYTEEWSADK